MARIPSAIQLGPAPIQGLRPRAVRGPVVRTGGLQAAISNIAGVTEDIQTAQERQQREFDAIQTGEALLFHDRSGVEERERLGIDEDLSDPNIVAGHQEWQTATRQSIIDGLPDGVSDIAKERLKLKMQRSSNQTLKMFGAASIKAGAIRADQTIKAQRNSRIIQAATNPDFTLLSVEQSKTDLMEFRGSMNQQIFDANAIESERDIRRAGIEGYVAKNEVDKAKELLGDSSEFFSRAEQKTLRDQIKSAEGAAANKVTALSRDHFASIQTTGIGMPGLRDEAQKTMKPDDFKEFVRTEDIARDFHSFTVDTAFAAPDEIVLRLEALRPKPGSEGFADRQRTFEAANQAARQIMAQRAKDPAAYAMARPDIAQAFQDVQNDTLSLSVATSMSLKAQEEMGIRNRQVLSRAQSEAIVGEWDTAPASERPGRMAQIQQQYGEHFPAVFKQLVEEGLSSETQVLGSVLDNPSVSRKMAEAIEIGAPDLKKGLESAAVSDLRAQIVSSVQPFAGRVFIGATTAERVDQVNSLTQSIEMLALLYMKEGANSNDAAVRAYNDIIGNKYDLDTIPTAYIPIGVEGVAISPAAVESTANASKTREIIEAFDPVPLGDPGPLDAEAHRESTINAAVNQGFWATNPAGTGVVLMVPIGDGGTLPILDFNGEPLEVDFVDATRFPRTVGRLKTGVERTIRSRAEAARQRRQIEIEKKQR